MTRTQNRSALRLLVVVVALMTVTGAFAPLAVAQDDGPPQPPHRVYGNVVTDAGDPVEGVTVEAVHDGEVVASDTTDADGYYDVDVEGLDDGAEFTVSPTTSSESETLTFSSASSDEVNFGGADEPSDGTPTPTPGEGTPTATPSDPGGGGGGGGAAPPADGGDDGEDGGDQDGDGSGDDAGDEVTVPIEDAEPDAPGCTLVFDEVVLEEIVFSNASASGNVTVVELDGVPEDRPALQGGPQVVAVADVTVPDAQRDESATLRMTVSQERLDELGIEEPNLTVFRLPDGADSWEELDAEVTETDAGVTIEFETPGFSTFAVAQQQDEQTPTPTATEDGTDTPTDPDDGSSGDEGLDPMLFGGVVLVVLLIAAGVAYYFTQRE